MGQYYKIINLDKQEYLEPWKYNCGAKLMEHSYIGADGIGNDLTATFLHLLANEWKGDRIVVAGDYADKEYMEKTFPELFAELVKEFPWLTEMHEEYNGNFYDVALYNCSEYGFNGIKLEPVEEPCAKYILFTNGENKYYCDLYDERLFAWDYKDDETGETHIVNIFAPNLLVALGNGLGGGDYYGVSEELVGSLAGYHLEFADEVPNDYKDVFADAEPFKEDGV